MTEKKRLTILVNLGYGALGLACVLVGALVPAAGSVVMVIGLGMLAHAAPSPGRIAAARLKALPPSERPTPPPVPKQG